MRNSERTAFSRTAFRQDVADRRLIKAVQCRRRGCRNRIVSVTIGDDGPRLLFIGSTEHFDDPEGGMGWRLLGRSRIGVGGLATVSISDRPTYIECRCGYVNRLGGPDLRNVAAALYAANSGPKAADE